MNLKLKDNPKLLPSITQLEYIESTGTQYIDTGISAPNGFKIEIDYQYTAIPSNYGVLVGSINASSPYCRNMIGKDPQNKFFIGNKGGDWVASSVSLNRTKFIASINYVDSVVINDTIVGMTRANVWNDSTQSSYNLYVFGNNSANSITQAVKIKLFHLIIYDYLDNIVREFIPAIDKNDVVCLYDTVSETFFYNQGTDDFVAGSIVGQIIDSSITEKITTLYHNNCPNINGYYSLKPIINYSKHNQSEVKYNFYKDSQLWNNIKTTYPDLIPYTDACHAMLCDICTCITPGPMQLASDCNDLIQQGTVDIYLESTGTQYIDTGFKPQAGDEFEVTYMITGTVGTYNSVFGTRVSTTSNAFMFGYISSGSYIELGSNNIGSFNKGYTPNVKYTIKLEGGKLYVNDVYDRDITVNQNTTHNLLLFTLNNNGSPSEYGRCRIYSFIIKRNGVKVLDLVPAYNGNVATMKDLVSDTLLTTSGSGNFTLVGTIVEEGYNITDYIPDCTYDETTIILLNRVRVDMGNVSGSLTELMQYSTIAGFNDNYEPQTKPRLVGTWTINDWYTAVQLAEAQAAFDGLTIIGDANISYDIIDEHTIHILSTTVPSVAPGFITSDITKIYIGAGSSSSDDSTLKASFVADSNWSSYSSLLDTYYNYLHPNT